MKKTAVVFLMSLIVAVVYADNIPSVSSGNKTLDELYKLAVREVKENINSDGAFYAGAKWQGVWTRDSAYSADLSLAMIMPQNVKTTLQSLLTVAGNIRQDTGTGGGYPISSDRIVWAIAGYSLAVCLNDDEFLHYVYDAVARSVKYDEFVTFDAESGLYRGETSFLDWREQTYPMSADCNAIGNSFALSTNILYKMAFDRLSIMADRLGYDEAQLWQRKSNELLQAIKSNFSSDDGGHLCSYILDNIYKQQYHGYDTLAVSLAILSDVVSDDEAYQALMSVEPSQNGMPVVSPQIAGVEPYHNNAVWPFVQAYRILAAAHIADMETFENEFALMMTLAERFGTFKENCQADNGDPNGTATNSDRQLWSDAGFIGVILRGIVGLNVSADEIRIQPVMPKLCGGHISVKNVAIGTTTLNIDIQGEGYEIESVIIDGKHADNGTIVRDGKNHQVMIIMKQTNHNAPQRMPHWDSLATVPLSPIVTAEAERGKLYLEWNQPGELFEIAINNKKIGSTSENWYETRVNNKFANVVEVMTVTNGLPTVIGSVLRIDDKSNTIFCEAETAKVSGGTVSSVNDANMDATNVKNSSELETLAYNGSGYISKWGVSNGDSIAFDVNIKKNGIYAVDIRYQNGNGPINTGSGCGIVAVMADGTIVRRLPLAQRGSWLEWGFSSPVKVSLTKGRHTIVLLTDQYCHNERDRYNPVNIDLIRVARISE